MLMQGVKTNKTNLISGILEGTVDIIIWAPHSRYTMFVIPESLLEVCTELAQNNIIRRLLINLCPESQPCPFT